LADIDCREVRGKMGFITYELSLYISSSLYNREQLLRRALLACAKGTGCKYNKYVTSVLKGLLVGAKADR